MRLALLLAISLSAPLAAQTTCTQPVHYGLGTPGSGGFTPMVSTVGPPLLGNASFAVQAGQTLGSAPVVQLLGFSQTSVPILGINVLVNPAIAPSLVATGVGPGMGQATFPLPIPNVAGFAGASLYAQIVTIDSGAALGLAASDGMQFTLCDQLVLLRDPTCANEPACFEQRGLMSSYKAGTPWAPSAFPLTLSAPTVMTRFVGMGSNGLSVVPWVSLTWTMNVWDSPSAFAASGLAGNIVANTTLAVTHIPVGNPAFLNHQVDMNVASPAGVALPPGSYYVSILCNGTGWHWRETPTDLGTDIVTTQSMVGSYVTYNPGLSYNPGSSYIKVWGY